MGERSEEQAEELEFIPWSQLVDSPQSQAPRLIYVAAAAVLALGVGAWLAPRVLETETERTPPPVTDVPVSTRSGQQESLLSESLRQSAVVREDEPLDHIRGFEEGSTFRALAVAEIFVHDYFTRDLDANRESDLAAWGMEHTEAKGSSYVEWARAYAAERHDDGWSVDVAFRVITSTGGAFVRQPIRFVTQTVGLDGQPDALPTAAEHTLAGSLIGPELMDVPGAIGAAALESISVWGEQVETVGGYETTNGWDVVVELATGAQVVVPIS